MAKNDVPERAKLKHFEITYRNFAGRPDGKYNRAGNRNFAIILDDETADRMAADGWYVKIREFEDGSRRNTLQVAVRFDIDKYRPTVVMVTPTHDGYFKRTPLNEDTIAVLDSARIAYGDFTLNPRAWMNAQGKQAIKAYLTTGYFVVEKDEFEDDYPEEEGEGIESGEHEELPF